MRSVRSHEGYLYIDNRNASVPEEEVARAGLPVGAGRGVYEAPTFTCRHCTRVVLMNPLRTRERYFCHGCSHYLCDDCAATKVATGVCRTWDQVAEETQEAAVKGSIIIARS